MLAAILPIAVFVYLKSSDELFSLRVQVGDQNSSCIRVFDISTGDCVRTIKGEIQLPMGLCISPMGDLFVASHGSQEIHVFTPHI